uniref:Uncharacterized protein n=1 Tax=Setaria italica TaxID=4555 RepID=K3ZYP7_SETIT
MRLERVGAAAMLLVMGGKSWGGVMATWLHHTWRTPLLMEVVRRHWEAGTGVWHREESLKERRQRCADLVEEEDDV